MLRPALSVVLAGLLCRTAQGKLATGERSASVASRRPTGGDTSASSATPSAPGSTRCACGARRTHLVPARPRGWTCSSSSTRSGARRRRCLPARGRPRAAARSARGPAQSLASGARGPRARSCSRCARTYGTSLCRAARRSESRTSSSRSECARLIAPSWEPRCGSCPSCMLLLGAVTVFSAGLGRSCAAARAAAGGVHPVIRALVAAVALQWAALLCEVLHLCSYQGNGFGAPVADALSGVLDMLSQVVIATLLVAIAHGYCLTCARARELPGLLPMSAVVAAAHVALVLLDKLWGEASHEHHETGGALGVAMVAMRLALFARFSAGIRALVGRVSPQLQRFARLFGVAGAAYLLSHPVLFLLAQAVAPYLRHPLLQVGLQGAQAVCSLGLAALLLSGSGCFYRASTLSGPALPAPGAAAGACSQRAPAGASGLVPLRRRGGA
ncbi:unnamed protein product [Prorocentrum cordatum]|uniref:GPR180/TMEM145 transmembrane domain-containing protein n=1 Tax=Prorocentrum cordatum TaxID=2364126 RepID=A0ABN9Y1T9_9DINO|nr:unnamed protein product [Polarella glacialis]